MTEFFTFFPSISSQDRTLKDITIRIDFFSRIKNNVTLYEYIQIKENQKPEDIAYEYYKDANLYWIILIMNDIVDPYHDWCLSDDRLYEYIIDKYGEDNIYEAHHYETTAASELGAGVQVNEGTANSVEVTNFDFEHDLNEGRRKIKILKPEYITQILNEYKRELTKT